MTVRQRLSQTRDDRVLEPAVGEGPQGRDVDGVAGRADHLGDRSQEAPGADRIRAVVGTPAVRRL